MSPIIFLVAIVFPLLPGCGALPHDVSRQPLTLSKPGSADAMPGPTPAGFLDLWRGFDGDLNLAPRNEMQFTGSMLTWDSRASGAAIAAMTGEVARLRRIWAEYHETKFHRISEAQSKIDAIKGPLRQLRRDLQAMPQTRGMQMPVAGVWWENQIARNERLGVVEPAGGAVHAKLVFDRYCEAKLWELAVTPQVLAAGNSERPLALGLCESVYAAQGFFSGPVCQSAMHNNGRAGSWFSCIWREGVFQSRAFYSRYNADKQSLIAAMEHDGYLREALASADRGADARASILGMKKARKKTFSRFENDPAEEMLRELFIPNQSYGHGSIDLATPRALLDSVEELPRTQSAVNVDLAFFPRAKIDALAFAAERDAHGALAALGKRDFVSFASTSDFMWNGNSLTMPWSEWMDVAENHVWLAGIMDAVPAPFGDQLCEFRANLVQALSSLELIRNRQSVVDQEFSEQAARALAASVVPGIAQAFWPEVSFKIFRAEAAMGVVLTGVSMALSRDGQAIEGFVRASAADCQGRRSALCAWLDSRTGAVRIKLNPRQLAGQGFALRVAAPADIDSRTRGFNEIPAEFDDDTSLEMVLYLGRIGRTPVISGRTVFQRAGLDGIGWEVEGEVSFLRL